MSTNQNRIDRAPRIGDCHEDDFQVRRFRPIFRWLRYWGNNEHLELASDFTMFSDAVGQVAGSAAESLGEGGEDQRVVGDLVVVGMGAGLVGDRQSVRPGDCTAARGEPQPGATRRTARLIALCLSDVNRRGCVETNWPRRHLPLGDLGRLI